MKWSEEDLCKCACHIEGKIIMHCFPCCDHCGEKYLNNDGSIIEEKLFGILRQDHLESLKIKDGSR